MTHQELRVVSLENTTGFICGVLGVGVPTRKAYTFVVYRV